MTIERVYNDYRAQLKSIYEEREALSITDWVLENIAGIKRIDRITGRRENLEDAVTTRLYAALEQLLQHKPVQYVLQEAWFYRMRFFVNENVLIPRPETEELVEWICKETPHKHARLKIIDIGTGSGCIAIALKKELPAADIVGIDISKQALSVASQNALNLSATIEFLKTDFLDQNEWKQLASFDIIVSNPPYIPEKERIKLGKNVVDYEPSPALFVSDTDPLIFYRKIALFALRHLNIQGKIYVEVHEDHAEEVKELFLQYQFTSIVSKDMYGRDRMVQAIR